MCKKAVPYLQTHHIQYTPEVTVAICRSCHQKIHGHGTGSPKVMYHLNPYGLAILYRLMKTREEKASVIAAYAWFKDRGYYDFIEEGLPKTVEELELFMRRIQH